MPTKDELRHLVANSLDGTIAKVNACLRGEDLAAIEPVLARIGRGRQLPHWYEGLKRTKSLPNLDGKTIGSVVEMLLVGILETSTFTGLGRHRRKPTHRPPPTTNTSLRRRCVKSLIS